MNVASISHQYLLHSYLYYIECTSIITDEEFNSICKVLLDNFESIPREYIHLIDKDNLKASTAYTIKKEEYPDKVIRGVRYVLSMRNS